MTIISKFISAITYNDMDTFMSLLPSSDVNGTPSPLICAAQHGRIAMMLVLLDAGADVDAINDVGKCACHVAIEFSRLPALEFLIARGANLSLRDANNTSLFADAIDRTSDRFAISLLDAGAPLGDLSDDRLMKAVTKSVAMLMRLLARHVAVDTLRDSSGRTACHVVANAAGAEAELMLSLLVNVARVDVNATDRHSYTACHNVAMRGNERVLRRLIELGADFDVANKYGHTALSIISLKGNHLAPCVEVLLAAGADFTSTSARGETPCHKAARSLSSHSLCALLAAGADFDQPDNDGDTPRQYVETNQLHVPTAHETDVVRRRLAKMRLDFVRQRALQVCIGLQPLGLDALQLCEVLLHSCGPVAPVIRFHQWWNIATAVKHFRD